MTDHPPKKRLCPAKSVEQVALETAGWSAVWRVISNAAVLLQNAQSYYDALAAPSKNGLGKLRKEAASLDEDEKRLILMCKKRMITLEDAERDLAPIRSRRTQIETELKAAGQVFTLPTMRVAEAAVREIHAGPEPETYQERRPILEKILDLRMTFRDDNGSLDIEGRVPVDAQIMAEKKCNRRINGDDTSVLAIPFKIQAQVKAA
jgi:hypothetical protein